MVSPPSSNVGQCIPIQLCHHPCCQTPLMHHHVPVHPPQTVPIISSVQPSFSFTAYIAPHDSIHILPPNSDQPPPLLSSNLYVLSPTNLSCHPNVKNSQIHSTFFVREYSIHSNPNMQASSGIALQQLEELRQQIAAIERLP